MKECKCESTARRKLKMKILLIYVMIFLFLMRDSFSHIYLIYIFLYLIVVLLNCSLNFCPSNFSQLKHDPNVPLWTISPGKCPGVPVAQTPQQHQQLHFQRRGIKCLRPFWISMIFIVFALHCSRMEWRKKSRDTRLPGTDLTTTSCATVSNINSGAIVSQR